MWSKRYPAPLGGYSYTVVRLASALTGVLRASNLREIRFHRGILDIRSVWVDEGEIGIPHLPAR